MAENGSCEPEKGGRFQPGGKATGAGGYNRGDHAPPDLAAFCNARPGGEKHSSRWPE